MKKLLLMMSVFSLVSFYVAPTYAQSTVGQTESVDCVAISDASGDKTVEGTGTPTERPSQGSGSVKK